MVAPSVAHGSIIEFTNKAAWQSVVPSHTTVDFTGYPDETQLSIQYTETHGVTFAGLSFIYHTTSFPNDGEGVVGMPGSRFFFETPRQAVAVDYVSNIRFELHYKGALIYTSGNFMTSHGSTFAGLISDVPFDEVYLYRPITPGLVFYDDLHFGPPIPAPGALGVFALAAFGCRRRRRS
ncbi:MAG TPA: hypothetical protein PK400_12675 [Phycisphaerales bacterium]|nr:hypothetical protein [Phycisphaerales bacterium]